MKWKRILEDEFHPKLRYYLIRDGPDVVGISPWIEKSVLNFRGLVSIPHSEANNIVLDDSFDADRFNEVLSPFARRYSFLHITTYNPALFEQITFAHVPGEETGHMMLDLRKQEPDALWAGLSKYTRYNIRIFQKDGFEIQTIDSPGTLNEFYHYYVKNLEHIQGEILPLAFFERLRDRLTRDELRVTVLTRDDTVAGGTVTLVDPAKQILFCEYLALNRDLPNRYTPSLYLFWDAVTWAWENGYEQVSFGRQRLDPNNPRFANKAKFGAEHIPIHSRLVLLSKTVLLSYKVKRMLLDSRNI